MSHCVESLCLIVLRGPYVGPLVGTGVARVGTRAGCLLAGQENHERRTKNEEQTQL